MASFKKNGTIADFQKCVKDIYSLPNDRMYSSIYDLLTQKQRFVMRALKGIRKNDKEKTKKNLITSLSWFMSVCNRLHINIEDEIWKRFSYSCSYCAEAPCACKIKKVTSRRKRGKINEKVRPKNLSEFQKMFETIYPQSSRSLTDAGVHLGEETGEVAEAIHNFFNQHTEKQFNEIRFEMADFMSCVFGVANSCGFDLGVELNKTFKNNCHVCKKAPCTCSFTYVMKIKT